jgi:hypothetical protein
MLAFAPCRLSRILSFFSSCLESAGLPPGTEGISNAQKGNRFDGDYFVQPWWGTSVSLGRAGKADLSDAASDFSAAPAGLIQVKRANQGCFRRIDILGGLGRRGQGRLG